MEVVTFADFWVSPNHAPQKVCVSAFCPLHSVFLGHPREPAQMLYLLWGMSSGVGPVCHYKSPREETHVRPHSPEPRGQSVEPCCAALAGNTSGEGKAGSEMSDLL